MSAERNAVFGWSWIGAGMAFGLLLGLWSFGGPLSPPHGLEEYAGPARRLLRLSHVAFIALGALNVLYALEAERLPGRAAEAAGTLLLAGSTVLPPCLAAAAFLPLLLAPAALSAVTVTGAVLLLARRRALRAGEVGGASSPDAPGGLTAAGGEGRAR